MSSSNASTHLLHTGDCDPVDLPYLDLDLLLAEEALDPLDEALDPLDEALDSLDDWDFFLIGWYVCPGNGLM